MIKVFNNKNADFEMENYLFKENLNEVNKLTGDEINIVTEVLRILDRDQNNL